MSATGYTVDLWIGEWNTVIDQGDDVDELLDDGALALAGMRVWWEVDPGRFPAGEPPHQLTLSLYVPGSSTTRPPIHQGQAISVTMTDPGWTPATGTPPFLEFGGQITDADADPYLDGLLYSLAAVDYRAQAAEETIEVDLPGREPFHGLNVDVIRGVPVIAGTQPGDQDPPYWLPLPWQPTLLWGRLARVFASSDLPFTYLVAEDFSSFTYFAATPAAPTSTAELVDTTMMAGARRDNPPSVTGKLPRATQVPCLVQELTHAPGTTRLVLDQFRQAMTLSTPFADDDELPYVLASPAPPLLTRAPRDPAVWALPRVGFELPAAAVDKPIRWRQDKAAHPTRVRIESEMFASYPATAADEATTPVIPSYTLYRPDQEQARGGAVARVESLPVYSAEYARDVTFALLGNEFDAVPRWSFDSVTFDPTRLPAGRPWPRMFTPAALPAGESWQGNAHALGRLVLVTGIKPEWNITTAEMAGGDVPGRLTGAAVEVRPGGKVACTINIRHTVPYPNRGAVTFADLSAAGYGTRVAADFGSLTAYDLWLTDKP